MKIITVLVLALAFSTGLSRAAFIVEAPTATTPGSLTITTDITFSVTGSGNATMFVFDEWVTSDGVQNGSSNIDYSSYPNYPVYHNNSPLPTTPNLFQADNTTFSSGHVTPNDGLLVLIGSFAVVTGDSVTLKAGELIIPPMSGFNPQATQNFVGNMFVADTNYIRLTDNVVVPEPSVTAILCGAGALALVFRRRSRRA